MLKAAIRCDASPELGFGHATRCLVLARELRSRGVDVVFVSRDYEHVSKVVDRDGFETVGIPTTASESDEVVLLSETCDLAVVDLLMPSESYQKALRCAGMPSAIVDGSRRTPCHGRWLLDPKPIPDPDHFERLLRRRPETEYLGGPRFALYQGGDPPVGAPQEDRVLLSMGGGDDRGSITAVVEILDRWERPLEVVIQTSSANPGLMEARETLKQPTRHHFELVLDRPLINDAAARSWCSILAGGVSCYELLSMGVPLILMAISDNQEPAGRAWQELEVAHYVGRYPLEDKSRLFDALRDLSRPGEREMRSRKARALCDGLGVERVADRLLAELGDCA